MTDAGAVTSLVVYENWWFADIALPATSATAAEIVTVYVVASSCRPVMKIACDPLQVKRAQPGLLDVIFVVFTVVQSMFSLQLMITLLLTVTSVVASAGTDEVTEGRVLSMVIVLPAVGVSILLDESVALL